MALCEPEGNELPPILPPEVDGLPNAFHGSELVGDNAGVDCCTGDCLEGAVSPDVTIPYETGVFNDELGAVAGDLEGGVVIDAGTEVGRAAVNMAACVRPTPSKSPGAARSSSSSRINERDISWFWPRLVVFRGELNMLNHG
jgi:hypothetical protein